MSVCLSVCHGSGQRSNWNEIIKNQLSSHVLPKVSIFLLFRSTSLFPFDSLNTKCRKQNIIDRAFIQFFICEEYSDSIHFRIADVIFLCWDSWQKPIFGSRNLEVYKRENKSKNERQTKVRKLLILISSN